MSQSIPYYRKILIESILLLFSKIEENGEFAKIESQCSQKFQTLNFAIKNQLAELNSKCVLSSCRVIPMSFLTITLENKTKKLWQRIGTTTIFCQILVCNWMRCKNKSLCSIQFFTVALNISKAFSTLIRGKQRQLHRGVYNYTCDVSSLPPLKT